MANAVEQMTNCMKTAAYGALTADHHLGYAVPVGGVVAYRNQISPSGVGFDISCGNCAVKLDIGAWEIKPYLSKIMDDVFKTISFGIGRINNEKVDHELFEDSAWDDVPMLGELKKLAEDQLGTVGSGNHYVDIFEDEYGSVWIGVHFGSRGLGHKIATHYIKAGGGKDGINVDPVVLDTNSDLGREYIAAMTLAGRYAYAGREWVCNKVAKLISSSANIVNEVHNHHNFAWREIHFGEDLWVVRKGATPAFPDQTGFIGASMGENSYIVRGQDTKEAIESLRSTVHGAGRIMSRTEAAGKSKWVKGKKTKVSSGKVSQEMMNEWVAKAKVELRGAGVDESPHCYKRLDEVLAYHGDSIKIQHVLTPLGVAMASADTFDPYVD